MCFEQVHPCSVLSDSSHAHPPHFLPNAIHSFSNACESTYCSQFVHGSKAVPRNANSLLGATSEEDWQ